MKADTKPKDKELEKIFEVTAKVQKCDHSFKTIRPNQIECTKCGFGFFDSPDEEFVFAKKN